MRSLLTTFFLLMASVAIAQSDINVYGTNVKRQAFAEVDGEIVDANGTSHGFVSPTIRKPGPGENNYDTSQADGELIAQTGMKSTTVATCVAKGSALGSAKVTKGQLSQAGAFFYIQADIPLANHSGSVETWGHSEVHQDYVATSVEFDKIQHEFKATFDLSMPHANLSWNENQHVHIDAYNNAVATYEPNNSRWHIVGSQTTENGSTLPIDDYVTVPTSYTFYKVADSLQPFATYVKYNQNWQQNGAGLFLPNGGGLFQIPGASVKLEHVEATGYTED